MAKYYERDLWLEAREKTRRMGQATNLVKTVMTSLPGVPTRAVMKALSLGGREKSALVIDLNKYRAGRDLQKFVDAGADAFILRMGGPSQWLDGDYKYQEDATWRPYMEQADKIGFGGRVAGYWIQNVFEDWRLNGLASNVTLQLISEWTGGGYMPPSLVCDHEVAQTWRNNVKITQTAPNIVSSLDATTDKVYKQWRKPVSIYTARWFTNTYGPVEHTTYFDNINRPESAGGAGKQRGLWLAWVPQTFGKEYADLETTLDELIIPNGKQTSDLLNIGSHSQADLWQYTFTLKLPGDSVGVDASVSLGTKEAFFAQFGFSAGSTPPVEPDPIPVELVTRVAALETWAKTVKVDPFA